VNSGLTKTEVGYCSVFFDRLKPVSVLENGNYWAHIDFIIGNFFRSQKQYQENYIKKCLYI
jgi:hypothetical protein